MNENPTPWILVRVRGSVGVKRTLLNTMEMLRLHRVNHAVILQPTESVKGMVEKTKDYLTYGEIEEKTLALLLEKRARLPGNKRLDSEWLEKKGYHGFQPLAKAVMQDLNQMDSLGIKPVFRLSPPSKGFERKGIKKPYQLKGALGYRGKNVNALVQRMA